MNKNLLITLDYPPAWGGVSDYYAQLVRHWPDGALDVLDNNDGRLWPCQLAGKSARGGIFKWLKILVAVARAVWRGQYQRVLVGQIIPLGWAAYVLRVWLGWIFKFEYGVFLHGLDFTLALKTARRRWLAGLILKRARWIICANSYTAGKVREFLGDEMAGRVKVVNPGVDVQGASGLGLSVTEAHQKLKLVGEPIILTVGRSVKRKGADKMLLALPQILKKYQRVLYVVLGEGPELENWRILAEKLGVANRTQFVVGADQKEKWLYYQACDLFVLPAVDLDGDYEGFGIVYLEAGLMGKPVVAGRSGGVADAVIDGQTGLIVDASQPENLTMAISKLLDDAELRDRMGRAGRERAKREFNWERQARRIAEILVE